MPVHDSALLAMLGQRGPRCHQGQVFTQGMYNLAHYPEMPPAGPGCSPSFEPAR